jgi:LuxR family quorum-sensing transcriptional regulator LasR
VNRNNITPGLTTWAGSSTRRNTPKAKTLENFIGLLECQSANEWQKSIFKMGNDYGFDQTLITVSSARLTSLEQAFLCSNFHAKWLEIYAQKQLIKIDPTVAHCKAKSTPLIWDSVVFSSKKQQEMYEEASGYGLRSGISLPFHGANGEVGILSFVNNELPSKGFKRATMRKLPELSMLRDFVFESSLKYAQFVKTDNTPYLTPREIECLEWCCDGKTSWEIAQILNCSESTVHFHFGNLRFKLKANSRRQILVRAFQYGLLHRN